MNATVQEYVTFDKAYVYFNKKLFDGELPDCIITFQRKAKSKGYFHAKKFLGRVTKDRKDEIALNPDVFYGRSDKEILSTLVHEMVHLWQEHKGTPPRKAYHDKQWSKKMENVGLMPSSNGEVGGKKTGQRMTHYTIEGGVFDMSCKNFLKDHKLKWQSIPEPKKESDKSSKTKFTCPECNQNAWAKPSANIICGNCDERMIEL